MEYSMLIAFFWSVVGVAAALKTLVPPDFYRFLEDLRRKILHRWSLYHSITISDRSGAGSNDLYTYAALYSSSLKNRADALTAECPRNAKKLTFTIATGQQVFDEFRGARIVWELQTIVSEQMYRREEQRFLHLTVPKADRDLVPDYLAFVMERGREIEKLGCEKELHTNIYESWESIPFNPPPTFDTIAMDPDYKALLMEDLTRFMKGKDFYAGVGRAWKRGYLLYGPPGTGKSSLIGAMSNFTGYDVYDLELTKVRSNQELRQLLIHVKDRAIVVVEDIDCSIPIENRRRNKKKKKNKDKEDEGNISKIQKRRRRRRERALDPEDQGVTLSGLLNFTDGLWSSCGSERIFVFTTNFVKRLDAALLRPGRMDMHIHMSYCSFAAFRSLAATYLKIEDHELYPAIEGLIASVKMTPASAVETLLRHGQDHTAALENVVKTLADKVSQGDDLNDSEDEEDDSILCSSGSDGDSDNDDNNQD
ncbi:AAA-ATPase At4g30250-like [Selaginella moellendorffii]|uniref:AAA-ATPase At4g30250-like n=1 Tax=Selaginella moellendorffii TaxID=88036 RepID=UPI000D1C6B4A|nr:AAA-ATPase At4g30250-like [Selaginella moellendorffii]|eukprot:XP_024541686.1 AAA-ATPase At4g30250-like [Selaginella moellendorffii]